MSKTTTTTPSKKPVKTIRSGAVSVSIWKKEGSHGDFFTANAQRAWKDETDTWQYSDSFSRDDLPIVGQLVGMAFMWIIGQEAKAAEQKRVGE